MHSYSTQASHCTLAGLWFGWQVPEPSQVSRLSQVVCEESPQAVLDLFPGMPRVKAADLALVYRRLVESGADGETVGCPEA